MIRNLLVVLLLGALPMAAQTPASDPVKASAPSKAFSDTYQKAQNEFMQGHYAVSLKLVDEALKLGPDQPVAYNLKGAILAKQQDFAGAKDMFEKTGSFLPNAWEPKFNVFELLFLQKKYAEARAGYLDLQKTHPKEGNLTFRIFMTYLLEGNTAEAKKSLDAFDPYGTDPGYYMSQAAWNFKQGKTPEGLGWVTSAQKIYTPVQLFYYIDCMIDEGWISRDVIQIVK